MATSSQDPGFGAIKTAYYFDGMGCFSLREWDVIEASEPGFCWYHIELPNKNLDTLSAVDSLKLLCTPLQCEEAPYPVREKPFCALVNNALVFKLNFPVPPPADSLNLVVRMTKNCIVSLGTVPHLGFSSTWRVPRTISDLLKHIFHDYMDHFDRTVMEFNSQIISALNEFDMQLISLMCGGLFLKKVFCVKRISQMQSDVRKVLRVVADAELLFAEIEDMWTCIHFFTHEDRTILKHSSEKLKSTRILLGFGMKQLENIKANACRHNKQVRRERAHCLRILCLIVYCLCFFIRVFKMNLRKVPQKDQNTPK